MRELLSLRKEKVTCFREREEEVIIMMMAILSENPRRNSIVVFLLFSFSSQFYLFFFFTSNLAIFLPLILDFHIVNFLYYVNVTSYVNLFILAFLVYIFYII